MQTPSPPTVVLERLSQDSLSSPVKQQALIPDTEAGDDFMATGPGPKRQEGGTVPGCEVAGCRLTQALVGDLYCEEPQPPRLIWNLPKPGSRAKGFSVAASPQVCAFLYPGDI